MKKHTPTETLIRVRLLPTGLLAMPALAMHCSSASYTLKLALGSTLALQSSSDCSPLRYQLDRQPTTV